MERPQRATDEICAALGLGMVLAAALGWLAVTGFSWWVAGTAVVVLVCVVALAAMAVLGARPGHHDGDRLTPRAVLTALAAVTVLAACVGVLVAGMAVLG